MANLRSKTLQIHFEFLDKQPNLINDSLFAII